MSSRQRVQLVLAQPGPRRRVGGQLGPLLADRGLQQRPRLLQDAVPSRGYALPLPLADPATGDPGPRRASRRISRCRSRTRRSRSSRPRRPDTPRRSRSPAGRAGRSRVQARVAQFVQRARRRTAAPAVRDHHGPRRYSQPLAAGPTFHVPAGRFRLALGASCCRSTALPSIMSFDITRISPRPSSAPPAPPAGLAERLRTVHAHPVHDPPSQRLADPVSAASPPAPRSPVSTGPPSSTWPAARSGRTPRAGAGHLHDGRPEQVLSTLGLPPSSLTSTSSLAAPAAHDQRQPRRYGPLAPACRSARPGGQREAATDWPRRSPNRLEHSDRGRTQVEPRPAR